MTRQVGTVERQDISKGPFRKDGRLIVSYPKSGRTWISFALSSAHIDATLSHAGCSTNRREIGYPFRGVPPQLRDIPLIFLHRNPIDTVVSMFYQVTRRDFRRWSRRWFRLLPSLVLKGNLPPATIDAFVRHPVYGVENICAHNRAWLDHVAIRTDCLILSYEELRAESAHHFQRILDFFKVTEVAGSELAARSEFDRMKSAEKSLRSTIATRTVAADPASYKVRRGKVAGYKDELQPDTIAYCEKILERYGFNLA